MSEANRKKEYERLINNDAEGKTPGISQDDGSLLKEFGAAGPPPKDTATAPKSALKKGRK